jgi:DNA-binding PadR family transcriptional regulator
MTIKEKVLKGVTNLLILRNIAKSPSYGYMLQKTISDELQQNLPTGEIYILLRNLERKKLIKKESRIRVNGRIITQYKITPEGKQFLKRHLVPMETVIRVLHTLIDDIKKMEL